MKNLQRRIRLFNILKPIKDALCVISLLMSVFCALIADSEGPVFKYIIIGMVIAVALFISAMCIERFLITYIIGDDIYYKPTFIWNDFVSSDDYNYEDDELLIEQDYYEWLSEQRLYDSDENYRFYCNHVA